MGFNKFKHLPKNECCECIKEHLLPQRSCDDIRKQLNYFSNSEQRQNQLKELLKKQKQLNTNSLHNYEFNIEIHYKSPYEQSENVHLPSQYTIIIERLRLAKVLKDTRKTLKEIKEKNIPTSSTPSKSSSTSSTSTTTTTTTTLSSSLNQISTNEQLEKSPLIEAISTRKEKDVSYIKINKEQKIRPPITKIASHNKRVRSESPTSQENDLNDLTTSILIQEEPTSSPPRSQSPIVLSSASPSPEKKNSQNHTFINQTINSNKMSKLILNPQRVIPISNFPLQTFNLTGLPQSTIILPSTNFYDLLTKPGNILNPTILNNLQTIPQVIQQPSIQQLRNNYTQAQSQSPVILPSNFSGTVLVQPTIHIHMDKKSLNMAKYCQIRPKQPGSTSTTNSTVNSSNLINKPNNNCNKKQKN